MTDAVILCVDDEPIGLRVRQLLLESQGYKVLTATSGREALEMFAAHSISAVVLDYAMPEMNGDQVAIALKRLNPEVKILLFSAYVNFPDEVLRWVDGIAVKGDHPATLFNALRKLLP
jgi:CheY-like chemotaxis protein